MAVALAILAFAPAPAPAGVTLGFGAITANTVGDPEIGEAQLSVDVQAGPGANQVSFTFNNAGPLASSITDIYFDDGTLLGIASITDGAGVDFEQGASPGNLPAANNADPDFEATAGFTADSEPPAQPNGVNPDEFVTIIFDLIGGQTYADTVAALEDGSLRIGIHVQGFASGGSESFVNEPPDDGGGANGVPEPSTMVLALTGLFGLGLARARRFRRGASATA
jgi:hypothetical protein